MKLNLDNLVTEYVEDNNDFRVFGCGCNFCEDGLIKTVDYVPYGSTSVPLEQAEICDCVWDNTKLQIHVYVQWLKQYLKDTEFELVY